MNVLEKILEEIEERKEAYHMYSKEVDMMAMLDIRQRMRELNCVEKIIGSHLNEIQNCSECSRRKCLESEELQDMEEELEENLEEDDIEVFGSSSENTNEFAIEWIRGRKYAGVTAPSGSALKNKILRLKESHSDDITHLHINQDGSIFCHIPISYVKISPPRQMSDEQRAAAAKRLRKAREN